MVNNFIPRDVLVRSTYRVFEGACEGGVIAIGILYCQQARKVIRNQARNVIHCGRA